MNQTEEVPESLGGLGDLLPADVLKMVNFFNEPDEQSGTCSDSAMARKSRMKFNELLEQLHRKSKNHQGSTVINIYGKGSLHVDHVDNQYFYGDKWFKDLQNKETVTSPPSVDPVFDKDTPLSALFRDNFHGELRNDLLDLDDSGALLVSLSQLSNYLANHTNLSSSYATLYRQLKKYRQERP